ncbi:MAG: EF-P lysine aminoacylase EpmA [Planctomycetota bacterium]|jgi:lysyl-tRNA synthetase class 2
MEPPFLPTADLKTLQQRARLLAAVRRFFGDHGYWECETPILSRDIVVDANLDPFELQDGGERWFLQTSPEAHMKRLLAAGATSILQISRVFRRDETGPLHNPEFTMIEWYRVGDDHFAQMEFTEQLVRAVFRAAERELASAAFERLTYDEAFERYVGTTVLDLPNASLIELARSRSLAVPDSLPSDDRDGWLNVLLAELVEPHLGIDRPQFLYDYPASQAALAIVREASGCPPVAERFELYLSGVELCNGYHELTDADVFAARTEAERATRRDRGATDLPGAPRLEAALRHCSPRSSGVALGFDRLAMLALGQSNIQEITAFPADRA